MTHSSITRATCVLWCSLAVGAPYAAYSQTVTYSDTWNDDADEASQSLPLYGVGITDNTYGDGSAHYVVTDFYDDQGTVVSSDTSEPDYGYTEALVNTFLPYARDIEAPANCAESRHFRMLLGYDDLIGESRSQIIPRRFQSVFAWSHQDALSNYEEVYISMGTYCAHLCQGPKYCLPAGSRHPFIYIPGWLVRSNCVGLPPYPRPSAVRPPCISPGFGKPIWAKTECGTH
jgi:hypothetical protein